MPLRALGKGISIKECAHNILLVSGSYSEDSLEGQQGFNQKQLNRICQIASQTKTQNLIFSLFSHCSKNQGRFNAHKIFEKCPSLKMISLEIGDLWEEDDLIMEVHQRGNKRPIQFKRHFACGADPLSAKEAFMDESKNGIRKVKGMDFIYCGSINIIRYSRIQRRMMDEFQFLETLQDIHTIFVPFHTAPKRWEIAEKQKFISQGGRLVITHWNKMQRPERKIPWRAFYNGEECSSVIVELQDSSLNENGIRIGFLKN